MINKELIPHREHLDIGQFNKRITFQTAARIPDGGGGVKAKAWGDDVTVWAMVKHHTIRNFKAGHIEDRSVLVLTTRYLQALDDVPARNFSNCRAVYNGRAYNVTRISRVNDEKYFIAIELDGDTWQAV
jgi:head-tail adaptor